MSTLFLATDPDRLAAELAAALDREMQAGDDLTPATVVVPNRALEQWLTLRLARELGVLINVRFLRLEAALWEWFREIDPRPHPAPPEMLDADAYQLLVLSVLLEEPDEALAPLRDYIHTGSGDFARRDCRRAWHLAGTLGNLIRDYEYHRQDTFIQRWLKGESAPTSADNIDRQRAQQAIFGHIVAEPDGRRARLNRATGRNFKTLPQYVMEVMEWPFQRSVAPRPLHIFGLTQISSLHLDALRWLARFFDLRVYGLNPLAAWLAEPITQASIRGATARFRSGAEPAETPASPGEQVLRGWGSAGAEGLHLLSALIGDGMRVKLVSPVFQPDTKRPKRAADDNSQAGKPDLRSTVLAALQGHVVNAPVSKERLPQDRSLQIVGCPGVVREVETVHNSILQNLHDDPTLRLSDIAVLVTDMARYRPALQAVFDRPQRLIPYSLIDFSAASASAYGQAVLGMLDLALESFTRSRVFAVMQNPCFLARLGVEREQVAVWETWADALGIHQGWDATERADHGLTPSPLHGWRQALRRLRLGRAMRPTPEDHDGPAARFGDVLAYADVESADHEQLAPFCEAVESLLPTLAALRKLKAGGRVWAERLRGLWREFLELPADRPAEAAVRDRLLDALAELELWDGVAHHPLPLALVREFIATRLSGMEARRGAYLTGGVTIAALQPMRPVPFRVIYVLGLNEDCFPGSNRLSTLDLRRDSRQPGDIRPAEHQRFLFLETLLSARDKLYLLYNCRDIQRDQALLPAVPVQQLQRWLGEHLTREPFEQVPMPLYGHDAAYFDAENQKPCQDVLVQHRPAERVAALTDAQRRGLIALDQRSDAALAKERCRWKRDFTVPAGALPTTSRAVPTLRIRDLERFLYDPAEASLKRHLHIHARETPERSDFEPLISGKFSAARLCKQVLQRLAVKGAGGRLKQALEDWPRWFTQRYDDGRLRSQAPEGEFAALDRDHWRRRLHDRILGEPGLAAFLRQRQAKTFCGPILIGEALAPIGPRLRFPALTIDLPPQAPAAQARIVGHFDLAWQDVTTLDLLFINSAKDRKPKMRHHLGATHLTPLLFYLALLANNSANREGLVARAWVENRHVSIHVATRSFIESIEIPPGMVTPQEAESYVRGLVSECLDPACFDHLPFRAMCETAALQRAWESPHEELDIAGAYPEAIRDALDRQDQNPGGDWMVSQLAETLDLEIPPDGYARMRRRFHLLDRPFAALRAAAPSEVRPKKGSGRKSKKRNEPAA